MKPIANNGKQATILEIQRMSTEDGPGLRTTVFFKGCSLKCSWCHNPESIFMNPQIHWVDNRCIGCKSCLESCPDQALTLGESGIDINRSTCEGCGTCAEECPSTALELMGETWTLEELIDEVVKDKAYFDSSEGGITISGGEPALQYEFSAAFLQAIKAKGIQTAFDTCGLCSEKALEAILPHTTIVLFDLKLMDSERHKEVTGASNAKILNNLKSVATFMQSHVHPKSLWIRTPIIPGVTDSEENISGIGRFIADNLQNKVERWELCAFNNLCKDKYTRLDQNWPFEGVGLMTEQRMNVLAETARRSGVNSNIVHWSGSTAVNANETKIQENDSVQIKQPICQ